MSALVIDGHPDARSLTAALARRYADGHGDARLLALRDLDFDPNLRFGYRERMTLEPDLVDARRALHEADALVVTTPLWWGSVPALLKGFFDRTLLPQQEYRYTKRGLPRGSSRRGTAGCSCSRTRPGTPCRSPECPRTPRSPATLCASAASAPSAQRGCWA